MDLATVLLAMMLGAAPASVTLHPGAQTPSDIGRARGTLTAASANGLVTVRPGAQSGVRDGSAGSATGTDTLRVADAAGDAVDVPVRVALDAGTFPSRVDVTVTGSPLQWSWLWSQIEAAIARVATVVPGAALTIASPSPSPPALPGPGGSLALDVPVKIAGGDAFYDAFGTAHVTVVNAPVEPVAPPLLFYDDDPERLDANGVVFRANVTRARAARLYYYHVDAGMPRRLVVALRSRTAAVVQSVDPPAGPNLDVLSVGHAVSRGMLDLLPRDEGDVYALAPGVPLALRDVTMAPKEGAAGSIDLNVLSGGPVEVAVLALAPDENVAAAVDGPLLPRDGHHRDGVFAIRNFGATSLAYTVGGPGVSTEYGTRAAAPSNLDAAATNGTDFGDYGVLQTLLFSLSNPTNAPAPVYLYERPLGGIVRSSFLVDGVVHEVGCVRDSKARYAIAGFELAPGKRYQLSVRSMTDGGSNYPIEIGLTATPPLPSAPPISSPDGCFPKPGH